MRKYEAPEVEGVVFEEEIMDENNASVIITDIDPDNSVEDGGQF